jgi:hypothetical protein
MERTSHGSDTEGRMPVVFAAHGAPVLLDDAVWMAELAAWARPPAPQTAESQSEARRGA